VSSVDSGQIEPFLTLAFITRFLINYAALPDPARLSFASLNATQQELTLYNRTNKQTYRNSVISALARLKKRPPAQRVEDCGTLEDDAERAKKLEEEEKGKLTMERVEKFVSTKEVLEKFDYVVEVPAGRGGAAPTEEGNVRKCDRCGTEFVVKAELEEVSR
jgi:RNA exonuclease 1